MHNPSSEGVLRLSMPGPAPSPSSNIFGFVLRVYNAPEQRPLMNLAASNTAIPENLPIEKDGAGVKVHPDKMIMRKSYPCEVAGVSVVVVRTGPHKVKFFEVP